MESTPRFPQSLEIATRFPHSKQAGDEADGKVENQKQVSHFPTARFSPSLIHNNPARLSASHLRPQHIVRVGNNRCPRMEKYLTRISREAYEAVLRFRDRVQMSEVQSEALDRKIKQLRTDLLQLGEGL